MYPSLTIPQSHPLKLGNWILALNKCRETVNPHAATGDPSTAEGCSANNGILPKTNRKHDESYSAWVRFIPPIRSNFVQPRRPTKNGPGDHLLGHRKDRIEIRNYITYRKKRNPCGQLMLRRFFDTRCVNARLLYFALLYSQRLWCESLMALYKCFFRDRITFAMIVCRSFLCVSDHPYTPSIHSSSLPSIYPSPLHPSTPPIHPGFHLSINTHSIHPFHSCIHLSIHPLHPFI